MDNLESSKEARQEKVRQLRQLKAMPPYQLLVEAVTKEVEAVRKSIFSPVSTIGEISQREQDIGYVKGLERILSLADVKINELNDNE
jgi:hypothetical protein